MKKVETKKRTINDFILGLNKLSFILIIFIYVVVLIFILFLITPKKDYVVVPNYEHETTYEYVHPQISLVGIRTYDEETDKMILRYSVSAKISGKLNENNVDPGYLIDRFQMTSYMTTKKMYYFTEQSGYRTPISHSFTMDNKDESRVPDEFFVKILFDNKDGKNEIVTFQEDVMLNINVTDLPKFSNNNKLVTPTDTGTVTDVKVNFITTEVDEGYNTSSRITVTDMQKNYHVDMQSWIVTQSGEALPFIGVYGYADQRSTYNQSNRIVSSRLNPEYIYCQLVYYVEGQPTRTIYYKEKFANLPTNYQTEPNQNETPEENNNTKDLTTTEIVLIASLGVLVIGGSVGAVYVINHRKKQNNIDVKK